MSERMDGLLGGRTGAGGRTSSLGLALLGGEGRQSSTPSLQ